MSLLQPHRDHLEQLDREIRELTSNQTILTAIDSPLPDPAYIERLSYGQQYTIDDDECRYTVSNKLGNCLQEYAIILQYLMEKEREEIATLFADYARQHPGTDGSAFPNTSSLI